ncbi:MAG: glutamate-5-semialdehyde dehydrogenase [Chitinispirillales bacterium]|jgi:glutamate-5-semialdehyde dehydrogenase|nr:glutamate-5-semialdehyde dehydrogenase [Chitinispirillales bacterium]
MTIAQKAEIAKQAGITLSAASGEMKNNALRTIVQELKNQKEKIFEAGKRDVENARTDNLPNPIIKRLVFDENKLYDVISGIEQLINLDEPVGKTLLATQLSDGLDLYRVSCPIGVIGVIFESRPDALVQISTLCLKSANAVILKGGSEAKNINKALFDVIYSASIKAGIPDGWAVLAESRDDVTEMLKLSDYIDLLIPRGSNEFVKYIINNTNIPVTGHSDGICHLYIDEFADVDKAVKITFDSKTQYVAVCNAVETLLVHENIANDFLPKILKEFAGKVELRGDENVMKILPSIKKANNNDWTSEYLDYILSIKIVKNLGEAIEHINKFGSGHTDSIVSENLENIKKFMLLVDSACVFGNCSTRFSDGYKFGFGAEVGVSTGKIHSRGPVGLDGLLIYKYKLLGNGHTVFDFANKKTEFTHIQLNKNCPL